MAEPRWQHLLPLLRAYVHSAWMAGEPTTISGAAAALGELVPRPGAKGGAPSTPIFTAFDRLEAQGVIVRDPALSSRQSRVIAAWNWAGRPLAGQSLRTALEGYLAAPVVTDAAHDAERVPRLVTLPDGRERLLAPVGREARYLAIAAVRAVVRARFGAAACGPKGGAGYAVLLEACTKIPAAELRDLPDAAKAAGTTTAGERYHAAINALLRYAAEHDLVALHVAPPQHAHPWAAWAGAHGVSPAQRVTLYRLYDAVRARRGALVPSHPDQVSIAEAAGALEEIAAAKGKGRGRRAARDLKALLVSLGLAGRGPFGRLATECSLVRVGPRQFAPRWVLSTGRGDAAQSWESTAALLGAGGFPPIWVDFYRWYARYSMLPLEALQAEWESGVTRPAKRCLDASTSRQRHAALRVWLGVAVHVLGMTPAECTPQITFGARFRDVLAALHRAWAKRTAEQERLSALGLPLPGHPITRDSPTLTRHVLNAGLIAEALAVWAEWRAACGQPVASPEECRLWRGAYAAANADAGQRGSGPGATLRSRRRTQKDIARIMADVSSLALVERSNRRVMERIRASPDDRETAVLVQRAIIGAVVAMGSPRIGELAILEYGRHYREQRGQATGRTVTRYLDLEAACRKAGGDHQIPLPEAVVPLALWGWHREHGRALLMGPWLRAGHPAHDAVFLSPEHGGPFGGRLPDYAHLDAIQRLEHVARCEANGAGALSAQYEAWRRGELAGHHHFALVEGARGHHAAHGARNQITRLLTELGLGDRLPYLLGHATRSASEEMYGTSLAATNAETIRRVLEAAPWLRGASPDADAPSSIGGLRRRTRAARAQLERDAALGRAARELVMHLQDLSPRQAYERLAQLGDRYARPGPEDAA